MNLLRKGSDYLYCTQEENFSGYSFLKPERDSLAGRPGNTSVKSSPRNNDHFVPPLFPVLPLQVTASSRNQLNLSDYSGSTLRGAFGWALKQAVCVVDHGRCNECFLPDNCLFTRVFDTQFLSSDREQYGSYSFPPRAFTIIPPDKSDIKSGEKFMFGINILGKPALKGEYWLHTLNVMAKRGLGGNRVPFVIDDVDVPGQGTVFSGNNMLKSPSPIYPREKSEENYPGFELVFKTPARLSGKDGLTDSPDPETLVRNLMRRLAVLSYFHNGIYWADAPFSEYLEEAGDWEITVDETEWYDWSRYSKRRDEKMSLGGIVGRVRYAGKVKLLVSLLEWGRLTHIGKNTTFGLGAYDLKWM